MNTDKRTNRDEQHPSQSVNSAVHTSEFDTNPVVGVQDGLKVRQESHAGEIIQIPVFAPDIGGVVTGLVTLPCSRVGTFAEYHPADSGGLVIKPARCVKAADACCMLVEHLGVRLNGVIRLSPILPDIPEGAGFGTSTSDIAAAMRLVLRVLDLPEERYIPLLAELAVKAELASDPLFHGGRTVLFGSRLGRVIEDFGGDLPVMNCLSFDLGAPVQTADLQVIEYSSDHLAAAGEVLECLRRGIRECEAGLVASAAMASAALNQEILPFPAFSELTALGRRFGALGLAISHSGSAATFLFRAENGVMPPPCFGALSHALAADFGVDSTLRHRIGGFRGR